MRREHLRARAMPTRSLPAALAGVLLLGAALAGGARPGRGGPNDRAPGGPPPGPPVLWAPPATAPELTDRGGWPAPPIMVAGAEAYRAGEYLYQDYVYDAFGANTTDLPFAPPDTVPSALDVAVGGMTGDLVYPTDVRTYGNDAADLLELRARLAPDGTVRYRVTLATMLHPTAAAVAIGIDRAPGGRADWGYGIGSLGNLGLDVVVVASGDGARSRDVAGATATVDPANNQIEIALPLRPGGGTWRHYIVVGLWDARAKRFKEILDRPTRDMPGGAHGRHPPPVFNVGFRFDEPVVRGDLAGILAHPLASRGTRSVGAGHWREHAQALALARRDIASFHADIDFAKLAAGASDESRVPRTGFLTRLYASRLDLGEGIRPERPMLRGRIQPYGLWVPPSFDGSPAPLTVLLHSLGCTYNQYVAFMPRILEELGSDRGSLVLMPMGRGPDGWYHDEAEVDLFEAWGDLRARYPLDSERVSIAGYSMGGYGTYRIASLYPDLFARAFAVVGLPWALAVASPADGADTRGPTGQRIPPLEIEENALPILESLRHVPLLAWNGLLDEGVPAAAALHVEQRLTALGYHHRLDLFPTHDHFLFSLLDRWGPGRDWLGDARVVRDPARVTLRIAPAMDRPALGLVHDHAYWVADVRVAPGRRSGLVDATSLAVSEAEPVLRRTAGLGAEPSPHLRLGLESVGAVARPARGNALALVLEGIRSLTLWPEEAGVRPGLLRLTVSTDHRVTIRLAGSFGARAVTVPAGRRTVVLSL
jgi:hypothetical protein